MARYTEFYIFSWLFIYFVISVNSQKCVQKSPCSCEFEDGSKIDLKQLGEKDFLTAATTNNGHNLTYYFHACSDKKPTLPSNLVTNECDTKLSLCLLNQTGNATAFNLGSAKDMNFTFATNSEKYLMFNNKQHQITIIIHISCSDYPESLLFFKQIDTKTVHNLILFSKAICPIFEKPVGLSTGSVLVIIFLTFSGVYLLGGAAILHFLRGARGKEMIPNFEFWTDLPNLVKDGAVFLQNGCKPVISNSDSYDRI